VEEIEFMMQRGQDQHQMNVSVSIGHFLFSEIFDVLAISSTMSPEF
jgi:hypothetical protein